MAYVFDDHRAIFAGFTLHPSISRLRTTTWNSKLSYDSKLLYNNNPAKVLGTMPRCSAHILICFTEAYIFQFSIPLWVGQRILHFRTVTVPSAIVHWHHNDAAHLPACRAWFKAQQDETLSDSYATRLVKLTHKMDVTHIKGIFLVQEPSKWRVFFIPVSNFTVFQHASRLISGVLNEVKSGCFEN